MPFRLLDTPVFSPLLISSSVHLSTVLEFRTKVLQELKTYLWSKLETLTRNFQHDVSVCGVAAWLLELHLGDLHLAQLRSAAAPNEAGSEPGVVQARICSFLLRYRDALDSRVVLEILGQHGTPSLLLYGMELYGMHVQAFHVAVRGVLITLLSYVLSMF